MKGNGRLIDIEGNVYEGEFNNEQMTVSIYGDKNADYPTYRQAD